MKGYEDFLNDLKNNEKLQKKVEEAQSPKDACDILKKEGYDVPEDKLTEFYLDNVSGGLFNSYKTEYSQSSRTDINGNGNVQITLQGTDASQLANMLQKWFS